MPLNNKHNSNINSSGFSEPLVLLVNFLKQIYVLIKPGVISLVIFTALCAMLIAPSDKSLFLKAVSLLLIAMGASGSAILNMWNDRVIDSKMERTKFRPIPAGNISANTALAVGLIFSFFSVVLLFFFANIKASLLLAFTIIYYSVFYTMYLKHRTAQNIVIGGLAGALPPVIAWISVSNELLIYPIILCLIIFLWTPSHFWALSIYKSNDYKKAKIPMLPIIYGVEKTKKNIFIYSLLMLPTISAPYYMSFLSKIYFYPSLALTIYYIYLCGTLLKVKKSKEVNTLARKIFLYSIFYLFIIFLLILSDHFFMRLYG